LRSREAVSPAFSASAIPMTAIQCRARPLSLRWGQACTYTMAGHFPHGTRHEARGQKHTTRSKYPMKKPSSFYCCVHSQVFNTLRLATLFQLVGPLIYHNRGRFERPSAYSSIYMENGFRSGSHSLLPCWEFFSTLSFACGVVIIIIIKSSKQHKGGGLPSNAPSEFWKC